MSHRLTAGFASLVASAVGGTTFPPEVTCFSKAPKFLQTVGECDENRSSADCKVGCGTCWPTGAGWGCSYYGKPVYCHRHDLWSCKDGYIPEGNGCYGFYSYRASSQACHCPPVEHCEGREYISCGPRHASMDTLHASRCTKCAGGFAPTEDGTACIALTVNLTIIPTTTTTTGTQPSCDVELSSRKDCGYYGIGSMECEARGCCWREEPNPNPTYRPWCFFRR